MAAAKPSAADFYAPAHIGLTFGIKDQQHKSARGHSGQDVNAWPLGTIIPSFVEGVVAAKGSDPDNFGFWITVRFDDDGVTRWAAFCHLVTLDGTPDVGAEIRIGDPVGPLGNSGYSFGRHLHGMVLGSSNPTTYRGVIDPLPYMRAARIAKRPNLPKPNGDFDMGDIKYRVTTLGKVKTWAFIHPFFDDGARVTTNSDEALGWENAYGLAKEVVTVSAEKWAPMLAAAADAHAMTARTFSGRGSGTLPDGVATKADVEAVPAAVLDLQAKRLES